MDKSIKNIIMGVGKWLKKQGCAIAFAMSSVEKNAFSQRGDDLNKNINQERRHSQGTLADSLVNGVVTAEVENLRWRTYKVLEATQSWRTELTYDGEGNEIYKHVEYDRKDVLKKTKQDPFDTYSLEIVVDNASITIGTFEAIDDDNITLTLNPIINQQIIGVNTSATHGTINRTEHNARKAEKPIKIYREGLPKFQIEDFATKLHIRTINETEKLLEFYISKYPNDDNRTTRLLISDIKKAIENPRSSSILDILEVGFITYKTVGVKDFLEFQYKITSFDKIVEFNGNYVIKFKANVLVNGLNILEQYRVKSLDEKYEKKEKKKQ